MNAAIGNSFLIEIFFKLSAARQGAKFIAFPRQTPSIAHVKARCGTTREVLALWEHDVR
ncbi:hypothetical protein NZK35_26855 [Stieleria sp. ICT_E10.1]|uniref:hypothetical protein n=1 Tax=Stieleria sedimenti TaxID=2976331 RepID=UPI00217F9013|nr:hypothetical protein [Stieleria sedimenti]MCS7470284.1 hypothetical protein [Stieleria sedimenti]